MTLSRLLRISRPRFWLYEFGTYAVGIVAAFTLQGLPFNALTVSEIAFGLYFLFPANLYIYGINDMFDYETDKLNPKKVAYEALVEPKERPVLWRAIAITTIPFLLFLNGTSIAVAITFFAFLFFAGFYSALPIRAKAIPGLDSFFSAGHYVATGVFGYVVSGAHITSAVPIVAAMAWAMAMHAYSAVPDITADHDGGVHTIATQLGKQKTIVACAALYVVSAILSFHYLGSAVVSMGLLYVLLMVLSLMAKSAEKLFTLYSYFPIINALLGMGIFFLVLFR
jgi:4-hydroxybenzoate polyprenyltransferase